MHDYFVNNISYFVIFICEIVCFPSLKNEHGIPEGEKTIAVFHGCLIRFQCVLSSRQGRYQHDQRRLRKMEIGDQTIQHLKRIARIDKISVLSLPGCTIPCSSAALSIVLQLVVPTQITLPPCSFVSLMVFAASSVIL